MLLDAFGAIPGEGTLLKGAQLVGAVASGGVAAATDSTLKQGTLAGIGLGLSVVDNLGGPKFTATLFGKSFSVIPVLGNFVSGYAAYGDLKEMGKYYDDCMAGKN